MALRARRRFASGAADGRCEALSHWRIASGAGDGRAKRCLIGGSLPALQTVARGALSIGGSASGAIDGRAKRAVLLLAEIVDREQLDDLEAAGRCRELEHREIAQSAADERATDW